MQQVIMCPNCGTPNAPGQKFCGVCGGTLGSSCPNCGAMIEPGGVFCGNCGAQMPGQQQGGWGQQPMQPQPPPMQQPWGQQYGGMPQQQGGWQQPMQPPPPPPQPPPMQQPWGQQYGGMQQQGGWQQPMQPPPPPPQPPPMQQPWGQQYGGMPQQPPWGQPRQAKSASGLIALLICLLIGLGGFAWWAFFGSPPWAASGGSTGGTVQINSGPFVFATADGDKVTCSIKWDTATEVQGQVEYGTSETYGSTTPFESSAVKSHDVPMPNLQVGTSYFYRVNMKDKAGKITKNMGSKFTTPKPATAPPPATPPTS
jgi:hypothetical protein